MITILYRLFALTLLSMLAFPVIVVAISADNPQESIRQCDDERIDCSRIIRSWQANDLGGLTTEAGWGLENIGIGKAYSDSPLGDYDNNMNASLTLDAVDVTGTPALKVVFETAFTLEENYDFGIVEYTFKEHGDWQELASYTGTSDFETKNYTVVIPDLEGPHFFKLRFRINTDASSTRDGWLIDNIRIAAYIPIECARQGNAFSWAKGECVRMTSDEKLAACAHKGEYYYWSSNECRRKTALELGEMCDLSGIEWIFENDRCRKLPFERLKARCETLTSTHYWDGTNCLIMNKARRKCADKGPRYEWTENRCRLNYTYLQAECLKKGWLCEESIYTNQGDAAMDRVELAKDWGIERGPYSDVFSDSPGRFYRNSMDSAITFGPFLTSNHRKLVLSFDARWEFEQSYDLGFIEILTDKINDWETIERLVDSSNWIHKRYPLDAYLNGVKSFSFRFRFYSDGTGNVDGWWIDNINLLAFMPEKCASRGFGFTWQNEQCRELSEGEKVDKCFSKGDGFEWRGGECQTVADEERQALCSAQFERFTWLDGACQLLPSSQREAICLAKGIEFDWREGNCIQLTPKEVCDKKSETHIWTGSSCRNMTSSEKKTYCAAKGPKWHWINDNCLMRSHSELQQFCLANKAEYRWNGMECIEKTAEEKCDYKDETWVWNGGECKRMSREEQSKQCELKGELWQWDQDGCRLTTTAEAKELLLSRYDCVQRGDNFYWSAGHCHVKREFLSYCNDENLDKETLHTVDVLKMLVDESECGLADRKLDQLKELNLTQRNLTNLAPLAGLKNLESLFVSLNKIEDLTPLSTLTALRKLRADSNKIRDLRPLIELANLEFISLWHNEVPLAHTLCGLKSREGILYLGMNPIKGSMQQFVASCRKEWKLNWR